MTESWMELLMERTISKEQTVDDLLRRSAGIPPAFIALFLAEPEGTPKKLLPRALQWLIDLAKKPLSNCAQCQSRMSETTNKNLSKTRDEGVIPTVHAFNVMRAAFNDANLAADTSGFSAEAMIVSIRSFSSPYWEVRNAATLSYTALLRRMVGFLNVHKRESARRSLTGLEFFHRLAALNYIFHAFSFSHFSQTSPDYYSCRLMN
jgi:thyroid adenoma-associated protein